MTNTNISISNYNSNNNNNYYHSHHQHNTNYEHENNLKNYEPRHFQELNNNSSNHSNQIASTVSMSTEEEAFDDFNLFDDDHPDMEVMSSDNVDVRMTFSMDSTTKRATSFRIHRRRNCRDGSPKNNRNNRKRCTTKSPSR